MATLAEIKKAILDASGNPTNGVVVEMVDAWAEAIHSLDNPSKEVRVVEAQEKR